MQQAREVATQEVQVSIRLPQSLLDRAEKLTARLREKPDNALMGLTRATVLRLAISRGLDALEAENPPTDKRGEPKPKKAGR